MARSPYDEHLGLGSLERHASWHALISQITIPPAEAGDPAYIGVEKVRTGKYENQNEEVVMRTLLSIAIAAVLFSIVACTDAKIETEGPTIVTEDNFPQAYTNMRLGKVLEKAGSVNTFFEMPVPPTPPEQQFVVRMNRDTHYSISVVDMSSSDVYITIPTESDQYVSTQVVDENHETQRMIYGSGRHKITAKTTHAFVIVRTLEDAARRNLVIEAGSAKPFVVKNWDMESFHAVDKAGNLDFSDGYDQSKAFGNSESGQTAYMNYVGCAGGWGGAMVEDNIYQTSPYFDADGCYEMTFIDPKPESFWSATVYNADGRMFNDFANISSEMNPPKNEDGTYTLYFGCDGQPNNIPVVEGNTTGKFNVLMRHYNPSEEVSNGEEGYDATKSIRRVDK